MRTLTIATEEGDIEIREDVLKGTRRGAESRRKEIGGTTATHC